MPAQPTTRWQVSGYNFLVRRMEHALVRRDVRMLNDPMRSQSRSMAIGAILATLGLAACAVLALLRPQDKIADAKIVVGKDSGAMFVVLGEDKNTLYPVLNLASARLATGNSAKPSIVKESEIGKRNRGPLLGIPGAPAALPFDKDGKGRTWTVCDSIDTEGSRSVTNSVVVGDLQLRDGVSELGKGQSLLLQSRNGVYLVYDGKRAKVDINNGAVKNALVLEGLTPRAVSPGLLNAIPEVPEVKAPVIDGAEAPSPHLPGIKVGQIVQVQRSDKLQDYVVLREGIQAISPVTKDLILFTKTVGEVKKLPQDAITNVPPADTLDVQTFPENSMAVVNMRERPISCLSWKPITGEGDITAELRVIVGNGLPVDGKKKLVPLAQADAGGDNTDNVYIPPGTGAYVQTTGIQPTSQRKDSVFFVADTGVRYGVKNTDAAKALGFEGVKPEPAPWAIVGLLAQGATLGREEAMIAHDGVAPDPSPAPLPSGVAKPN